LLIFNEQVIGYQPSLAVKTHATKAGHFISVVFIPRKPHPNGLILYLVGLIF